MGEINKPVHKKAVLMRDVKKVSREIIMEDPKLFVFSSVSSSVSVEGIPDSVKEEICEKHEAFWKDILQTIEAHTEFAVVQAFETIDDSTHKQEELNEKMLWAFEQDEKTGSVTVIPLNGDRLVIHDKQEAEMFSHSLIQCFQSQS